MKRLYYTDPLAAAWMYKHHGVQLELIMQDVDTGEIAHHALSDYFQSSALPTSTEAYGLRYYIHPESLHLLEPIENDVVILDEMGVSVWHGVTKREYNRLDLKVTSIIQRNNIPFHWPESEDAST